MYVPDSALEDEEKAATGVTSAAHYLAFIDGVSKVRVASMAMERTPTWSRMHGIHQQ